MKDISLRDILRYFVAGGALVLTLSIIHNHARSPNLKIEGLGDASLIVGVAGIVGEIIYSFHRGLIYPLVFKRQIGSKRFKQNGKRTIGFASIETEVMWSKARWTDAERAAHVANLSEW